jgi:hypothetical protein
MFFVVSTNPGHQATRVKGLPGSNRNPNSHQPVAHLGPKYHVQQRPFRKQIEARLVLVYHLLYDTY